MNVRKNGFTLDANFIGVKMTLPTVTKTGHTCSWHSLPGNSGGSKVGDSGGEWTPNGMITPTNVKTYARCTPNVYNISYVNCGNLSATGMPNKYTYGVGAVVNGKPVKTIHI